MEEEKTSSSVMRLSYLEDVKQVLKVATLLGYQKKTDCKIEMLKIKLTNCSKTEKFSRSLVQITYPKDVLLLEGPLGAGKSHFARAFIREAYGADIDVPSPTYTLVQHYETQKGKIAHYDLYRIKSPEELIELGFEEDLATSITLIEWPERLGHFLPKSYLHFRFEQGDHLDERIVTLAYEGKSADLFVQLKTLFQD